MMQYVAAEMANRSHLYQFHLQYGKITDFAGFDMPLWYTSIIDEHMAVRNAAGLFDVSHMGRISITGNRATDFLDYLLPTFVANVENGRAFYSVVCKENGGIIDDTVTNKIDSAHYIMVVNAANREKDLNWIRTIAEKFDVSISDQSNFSSLIALQGPISKSILQRIADVDLSAVKKFHFAECKIDGEECLVSRTGYTGEDGFEILVYDSPIENPVSTVRIWQKILDLGHNVGLLPCGLGARDSLRLEAGMCLYGQDIDETTSPIEGSLESVVQLEKSVDFVGRATMESQIKSGVKRKRIAFSMFETGIPRRGHDVIYASRKVGSVTSGSFSPLLKKGIGMAYLPTEISNLGNKMWIRVRGSDKLAEVVKTPFYDTTLYGSRRKIAPTNAHP
ncbi:MAG: glycine cleavage system aminomethyltransferase GcvT [Nitrososphaerota archaeon]|nr:glycine cleavage system aminomethyltransferase GcvT [Nitrososphaerota archaeon]